MLFTQFFTRALAVVAIVSTFSLQYAAMAEETVSANENLTNTQVAEAKTTLKHKNKSLLTDSLWGNLILEMAYERDPKLSKLSKRVNLMNFGTAAAAVGIAGGTLGQGIWALAGLNQVGHQDTYAPGEIGVALSGCTIVAMASRMYLGHKLAKHIRQRQIELRDNVQTVLAQLENSHGQDPGAQSQLKDLVGDRACNEWLNLWRTYHQLAQRNDQRISITPDAKTDVASSTTVNKAFQAVAAGGI